MKFIKVPTHKNIKTAGLMNKKQVGHLALDIVGIIPGAELADIANALWYLVEKDFENAALSLISAIPIAGDVAGKGTKAIKNSNKIADVIRAIGKIFGKEVSEELSKKVAPKLIRQVKQVV